MAWVRIEATERRHPKMVRVPIDAYGFHVAARGWAVENLTDGFIPAAALGYIYPGVSERRARRYAEILAAATDPARPGSKPLWEVADGGWRIHDFLDYQESAAEIRHRQDAARKRQKSRRHRQLYGDGHDCHREGCHAVTHADVTAGVTLMSQQRSRPSDPIRSVPYRSDPSSRRDATPEASPGASPASETGVSAFGAGFAAIGSRNGSNNDQTLQRLDARAEIARLAQRYGTTLEALQAAMASLRERESQLGDDALARSRSDGADARLHSDGANARLHSAATTRSLSDDALARLPSAAANGEPPRSDGADARLRSGPASARSPSAARGASIVALVRDRTEST